MRPLVADGLADSLYVCVAVHGSTVIDIAHIQHRLVGEQEQLAGELLFLFSLYPHTARRTSLLQRFPVCRQHSQLHLRRLVGAGLRSLLRLGHARLYCLQILDLQFIVDHLHVAHRVDGRIDMRYVVIVETAEHMQYGIRLPDIGKKFVSETFTFRCAFHQTCNVDDLNRGGHHRLGGAHIHEPRQTVVGNRYHAHIGLYRTEREIGTLSLRVAQAIEQGRLTHVGQSHYSTF